MADIPVLIVFSVVNLAPAAIAKSVRGAAGDWIVCRETRASKNICLHLSPRPTRLGSPQARNAKMAMPGEGSGRLAMRVLVGWDDDDEIELLTMYLEADDNVAQITRDPVALTAAFETGAFDVVLLPVSFPDAERSFAAFEQIRRLNAETPVIVAARPGEIYPLSRFIGHGVQTHVYRDPAKEYMFLLQTLLESALVAKRAEQARLLSEKLRSEIDSVRKLQESMIPRNMPAPPGYEVVARYEPSQIQVSGGQPVVLAGGDYYYAFQVSSKRLVFLV